MTGAVLIHHGPWRIHNASVIDGQVSVSYNTDGKWDTIASETHEDLALLRDAITEYLQAVEAAR